MAEAGRGACGWVGRHTPRQGGDLDSGLCYSPNEQQLMLCLGFCLEKIGIKIGDLSSLLWSIALPSLCG